MSTYAKLEHYNAPLSHYQASIKNLFLATIRLQENWQRETLFSNDPLDTNPLIIVVASSKGLCGGFNGNLFRFLDQHCFIEEHQQPSFIAIGTRAIATIEKEYGKNSIVHSFEHINIDNILLIAQEITQHIAGSKQYSSVSAFSNFFQSFFLQRPEKTIIAPLQVPTTEPSDNQGFTNTEEFIWEQNPVTVLEFLSVLHIKTTLLHIFYQSLLAEQASRFLAMDNATSNAEHMLEKLTLEYNKLRQNLITRELSELTASLTL